MGLIVLFFVAFVAVAGYIYFTKRKNLQEKRLQEIGNNLFDPGSWQISAGIPGTGLHSCFLDGTIRGRKVRYTEDQERAAIVIECGDVVDVDRAGEIQEQVRRLLRADSAKFYASTVFHKTILLADSLRPYSRGFQVWKSISRDTWNIAAIQDCLRVLLSATPNPHAKDQANPRV